MGFNANDYIGSSYLNAQIVKEEGLGNKNLMIVDVSEETFEREGKAPQKKLGLKFAETDRILVLNSTNTAIIKEKFTSDTDLWKNKVIQLFLTKRKYMGDLVDSIQINADIQQVGGKK